MKKLSISVVLLISSLYGLAQSQGISYQAIIIDQQVKEIPGIDVEGSYVPNRPLTVRFSILNEVGDLDYQEDHNTQTDAYGMINLFIGQGTTTGASPTLFNDIDWDGTPKDLRVEVSLGEATTDFTEFSFQQLTFVPYAYHRNITATGDLTVGGKSTFNGEVEFQDITVQGQADLNGGLNVNNNTVTNLSGDLNTLGTTNLSGDLNTLGTTNLFGDLVVQQTTTLNNSLEVNSTTGLNGQVTINADVNGADNLYNSYPLRVEGSNQGIAIRVDGNRSGANNFVTFWDGSGVVQGRIEGQTLNEVVTSPQYIFDQSLYAAKTIVQVANVAIALGFTPFDPGNPFIEAANAILLASEITAYEIFTHTNVGVTYESGSGDYAEWLPRLNPSEKIEFAEVVGVYGGKVTKRTDGAEMVMVVSRAPIVLGNMPPNDVGISNCEKVGFMGQVPVWVVGKADTGDYILPSGGNNGFAIAKHPADMGVNDYRKIIGVAWSSNTSGQLNLVNVAIGLNTNDVSRLVAKQQEQITALETEIKQLQQQQDHKDEVLVQLVPGYKDALEKKTGSLQHTKLVPASTGDQANVESMATSSTNKPAVVVTREHVEMSIELIEQKMIENGQDISKHPIFSHMKSDPAYKEEVIAKVMELVRMQVGK